MATSLTIVVFFHDNIDMCWVYHSKGTESKSTKERIEEKKQLMSSAKAETPLFSSSTDWEQFK